MDVYARLATIMVTAFGAATHVTRREYRMRRLVSIVEKKTVVRARDLYRSGIHPETLSTALQRGLLLKIGRGLYARKDFSADFERQIMLACKRVPNGKRLHRWRWNRWHDYRLPFWRAKAGQ